MMEAGGSSAKRRARLGAARRWRNVGMRRDEGRREVRRRRGQPGGEMRAGSQEVRRRRRLGGETKEASGQEAEAKAGGREVR